MIDRYFAYKNQLRNPVFPDEILPEEVITEPVFFGNEQRPHDTLTVVFSPWHSPPKLMPQLGQRLNADGSDALVFDYHSHILNPDPASVRANFEYLSKRAGNEVRQRAEWGRYASINLLGFSLGNVVLSMTAERVHHFDKVTMVVPGTDLLTGLWHGIRTRRLRAAIEAKHATEPPTALYERLSEEWARLAPQAHLDVLRGHEVDVVLSSHDEFIPYRFGQKLVSLMEEIGLQPDVRTHHRRGHALAIRKYVLSK